MNIIKKIKYVLNKQKYKKSFDKNFNYLKCTNEIYNINKLILLKDDFINLKRFKEVKEIYEDFLNKGIVDNLNQWELHRTYYKKNKIYKLQEMFLTFSKYW